METIFLLGIVQAVFLALILLSKNNKMLADKILCTWLFLLGAHLLSHYMQVTGLLKDYPVFHAFSVCFPMLEGAFIFLYAKTITSKIQKFGKWDFVHVAHYIILTSILFIVVFFDDELTTKESVHYLENNPTVLIITIGMLNVFLGPFYLVLSYIRLIRHKKNISRNFSYTENIDLKWLLYIVTIMGGVWLVVVITNLMVSYIDPAFGGNLIYIAVTLAVFFIGFFGIKQQVIYASSLLISEKEISSDKEIEVPQTPKVNRYEKSGLKPEESSEYLTRLKAYMEEERPYLNGKLTLKETAEHLGISVNHVSQVINEQLDVNFFDFVNGYRVEEVKRLLADPEYKQYTLLTIAYDSGFNSKSSFNSVFKKFTGHTPSGYINQASV